VVVASALDVAGEGFTEDDDSGAFIGVDISLRSHLGHVRRLTEDYARRLGLSDDFVSDLALAAGLHDIGKADPRFQRLLAGGNEVRLALQLEPLAKSRGEAKDIASRERARERSAYPPGYRHELLSVVMLERSCGALDAARDRDLVLHLVGSHHGWCRPFSPANDTGPSMTVRLEVDGLELSGDAAHALARLDSGVADRFFELLDRYGWWGLAWLEAIVRLADHRASEAAIQERSDAPKHDPELADLAERR
jgi:CRISPR-associated endonuclease/helicase Cas3